MVRPAILVVEREPLQALSARKLVLETTKFNVLTAHSTEEALSLLEKFPNIALAVLSKEEPLDCDLIAEAIKKGKSRVPVVGLSPGGAEICEFADHTISSHDPESLLFLIRTILGDPRHIDRKQS